ncbi:hypothetical protein HDV00_002019 [Rhizophlyctis rosea]|nr:hypothetical protein HDV00_002019 [Rhizophlyctis rosea]
MSYESIAKGSEDSSPSDKVLPYTAPFHSFVNHGAIPATYAFTPTKRKRLGFIPRRLPKWCPKSEPPSRFVSTVPRWVGFADPGTFVQDLKERRTEYQQVQTVYYDDSDGDAQEQCFWTEKVDVDRWEDRTTQKEWQELEDVLRSGKYGVLRLRIRTYNTVESDSLRDRLAALRIDFAETYLDKKPELRQNESRIMDYKIHTDGIAVIAHHNHNKDEEKGTDNDEWVQETTLYVYRGTKRPWWTEERWFRLCAFLYLGAFWEWRVGYLGYGVKKLTINRAFF